MNPTLSPSPTASHESRLKLRAVWFFAVAPVLVFFVLTASRDVQWQDSGWQQFRIVEKDWHHPRGLALVHPLHHFLGRFAVRALPFLEPAHSITLVSALAGAIAVANVACTVFILTRRRSAALFAAVSLALSHTFWQHATHTESYSLTAALLSGEWLCLSLWIIRSETRWLLLVALLNGLGVSNHLLAALVTPVDFCLLAFAWKRRRISGGSAVLASFHWLAGAALYAILVIQTAIQTGDVSAAIGSALFGEFKSSVLNTHLTSRSLGLSVGYLLYNFPNFAIPLAVIGLLARSAMPRSLRRALIAEGLILLIFVARYSISDQYTYFIPIYVLIVLFASVGLAASLDVFGRRIGRGLTVLAMITAAWTPLVYRGARDFLSTRGIFSSLIGNKPYRDGYRAFFIPWGTGEDYGRRLNEEAARLAAPNGIILVIDSMPWYGLQYAKKLVRLPSECELVYFPENLDEPAIAEWRARLSGWLSEGRPVILVPRDRDRPETSVREAQWHRVGDLYVLSSLSPGAI